MNELREIKIMLETLLQHTWAVLDADRPDEFTNLYDIARQQIQTYHGEFLAEVRQEDLRKSSCQPDYPEALESAIAYQIAHKNDVPIGEDGIFYVNGRAFSVHDGDD
jgi:hypothetical protein